MTFAFAGNERSIPGFCFGVGRGLVLNGNAGVGAERVVDHTAAAVVAFVDGVSEGRPGIEEVARVKERTVVAVVGAAGVTGDDVGAPKPRRGIDCRRGWRRRCRERACRGSH